MVGCMCIYIYIYIMFWVCVCVYIASEMYRGGYLGCTHIPRVKQGLPSLVESARSKRRRNRPKAPTHPLEGQ